jgi:hypothetical protein
VSVQRLAREPLLHFAALGALIFAVHAIRQRPRALGDRIVVDQAMLARLDDGFRRAWLREPTRDERAEMVLDQIDDEILYREALARHLDRDDPAVRRRLIEKVTVSEQPHGAIAEPSETQLRTWFEQHRHHFREAARFSFRQVFFDPRRRGPAINDDARAALAAAAQGDVGSPAGQGFPPGDPGSLPEEVKSMPEVQVAHLFGKGFADSLASVAPGVWQGPLSSTQGLHLVRLTERLPARDPPFEEVRPAVRADWLTARSKGYLQAAAGLLGRYHVEVTPEARPRLEGAPLLTPVLR